MVINREMAERNEIEFFLDEIDQKCKPAPKNEPSPIIVPNAILIEVEEKTKKLMIALEDWREIIVLLRSILLWDKKYYSWAILGGSSLFFLCLWLLDPSLLTTFSLIGLTVTISDYVVPLITHAIFKPESWTDEQQDAYYNFCFSAVLCKEETVLRFAQTCILRTRRPKTFYGAIIFNLVMFAWVGNVFNNLFLTYMIMTIMLLVPGMSRYGFLGKVEAIARYIESEYLTYDCIRKND